MISRMILAVVLIAFFASPAASFAAPKSTPCKIYETNVCIKKSKVSRRFTSKLPSASKYVSPNLRYTIKSGSLVGFPNLAGGTPYPEVLIPAGTETKTICGIQDGKWQCVVLSAYKDCPSRIELISESGQYYTCDVQCLDNRPNSSGNCDCDIKYDTCTS